MTTGEWLFNWGAEHSLYERAGKFAPFSSAAFDAWESVVRASTIQLPRVHLVLEYTDGQEAVLALVKRSRGWLAIDVHLGLERDLVPDAEVWFVLGWLLSQTPTIARLAKVPVGMPMGAQLPAHGEKDDKTGE